MNSAWETLRPIGHPNLTIILYIVNHQPSPYHIDINYKQIPNNNSIYFPFNLLRDIAIEYISTTHYFVIDGDIVLSCILSHTQYKKIDETEYDYYKHSSIFQSLNIFVISSLLQFKRIPIECLKNNNCKSL